MKLTTYLFAFLVLLLLISNGKAAILLVTTNEDTNDGVCNAHCSLREALAAAQPRDTIIFDRSLRGTTIQLNSALVITKPLLTIDGPNKRRITLRGSGSDRVIKIITDSPTIDGFIITNGYFGGENAQGGGGIYSEAQVCFIINCIITGNYSRTNGGGIATPYSRGRMRIWNSAIINNRADGDRGGGGIYAPNSALLEIYNTTIANNTALAPTATGGVWAVRENIEWLLVTVTGNRGGAVGGVYGLSWEGPGRETLTFSIIAGNIGPIPDMDADYTLPLSSLIGVDSFGRYQNGANGAIIGTPQAPADPRLAPLGDYGGNIPTAMLLADSPVRDATEVEPNFPNTPGVQPWDARRYQRVVNNNLLDWGAVEYGAMRADTSSTIKGRVTMSNGRSVANARVTLRDTATGAERLAQTNPFGYYQIANVPVDKTYRLAVQSKKALQFTPQTFVAEEEVEYADFISQ